MVRAKIGTAALKLQTSDENPAPHLLIYCGMGSTLVFFITFPLWRALNPSQLSHLVCGRGRALILSSVWQEARERNRYVGLITVN